MRLQRNISSTRIKQVVSEEGVGRHHSQSIVCQPFPPITDEIRPRCGTSTNHSLAELQEQMDAVSKHRKSSRTDSDQGRLTPRWISSGRTYDSRPATSSSLLWVRVSGWARNLLEPVDLAQMASLVLAPAPASTWVIPTLAMPGYVGYV